MDKSILWFFGVTSFVFCGVLWIRFLNYEPCTPIQFKTTTEEKRAGQLIKFVDYTIGANTWEWHFGDSTEVKTEKTPYHVFKKPGKYEVKLIVNGKCTSSKVIAVKAALKLLDSTKLPVFEVPDEVMVGEKLEVVDNTKHAKEWEWRFGESLNIDSYKRKAEYIYTEPGLKTISLVVNGDLKHVSKKKIKVLPKPKLEKPTKTPVKKKSSLDEGIKYEPIIGNENADEVPFISEKAFADKLIEISNGKALATYFQPYMCGKLNMPIVVNKKNMDFLVFCQKIRNKGIVIKELSIVRTPNDNCIKNVIIKYRKSFF